MGRGAGGSIAKVGKKIATLGESIWHARAGRVSAARRHEGRPIRSSLGGGAGLTKTSDGPTMVGPPPPPPPTPARWQVAGEG